LQYKKQKILSIKLFENDNNYFFVSFQNFTYEIRK